MFNFMYTISNSVEIVQNSRNISLIHYAIFIITTLSLGLPQVTLHQNHKVTIQFFIRAKKNSMKLDDFIQNVLILLLLSMKQST